MFFSIDQKLQYNKKILLYDFNLILLFVHFLKKINFAITVYVVKSTVNLKILKLHKNKKFKQGQTYNSAIKL